MKIKQCFADVEERKILLNYIENFITRGIKIVMLFYPALLTSLVKPVAINNQIFESGVL